MVETIAIEGEFKSHDYFAELQRQSMGLKQQIS